MKRLLICVLILNALLVGDRILLTFAASSGGAAGTAPTCTTQNGDIDGNGTTNIDDPIRLLRWMFLGDPPGLVPFCQPQAGSCLECPDEGRFIDNGDGTVTDTCTGLMWQQDTVDVNGDGRIEPFRSHDVVVFSEALAYADNLILAGHDNWRLPTLRELISVVDFERPGVKMDPTFFGVDDYWYWASNEWGVKFDKAELRGPPRQPDLQLMRAVRDPQ